MNPFFILLLAAAFAYGRLWQALMLFAIVMWHEAFHILTAKAYRLQITDVELLPFGGVTRMDAMLQLNPEIEWAVAAVGPLSNGLLIFFAYALLPYFEFEQAWFEFFVQANIGMALFNLIPALPLDGGRVLRSFGKTPRLQRSDTGGMCTGAGPQCAFGSLGRIHYLFGHAPGPAVCLARQCCFWQPGRAKMPATSLCAI